MVFLLYQVAGSSSYVVVSLKAEERKIGDVGLDGM